MPPTIDLSEFRQVSRSARNEATFSLFSMLLDEVLLHIFSFAADVPFETDQLRCESTLTHAIPFVSRRFYHLVSETDVLWRNALERLILKEPFLWKRGIDYISYRVKVGEVAEQDSASEPGNTRITCLSNGIDSCGLINKACKLVVPGSGSAAGACTRVFQEIVSRYVRFTSPVFHMPGFVQLGSEFGLHFFEPRYRLLIHEVMADFPLSLRRGNRIHLDGVQVKEFPKFIYANHQSLGHGSLACIVEVKWCQIHANGTADVLLCPSAYIWIEAVWKRPNSGLLYEARGVRMTKACSESLERQVLAYRQRPI